MNHKGQDFRDIGSKGLLLPKRIHLAGRRKKRKGIIFEQEVTDTVCLGMHTLPNYRFKMKEKDRMKGHSPFKGRDFSPNFGELLNTPEGIEVVYFWPDIPNRENYHVIKRIGTNKRK